MRFFKFCFLSSVLQIVCHSASAQLFTPKTFTRQDTLRGSITPERSWWDVTHYDITVVPDTATKSIYGFNKISFEVTGRNTVMQLDLQEPMQLDSVLFKGKKLALRRDGNVFYVSFPKALPLNSNQTIIAFYSGTPRPAKNAPWDGGWIWKKDHEGLPFISVACQGLGASVWYPNKDHQSDEPDSAALTIVVPQNLTGVGNGKLASVTQDRYGRIHYRWEVKNPINNYNIIPYIGNYTCITDTLRGEKGVLHCSYWVLKSNVEKAKNQFKQVKTMLHSFEHWFGPYPFYEDGYKLVEAPHLGMEHQSNIAYGNNYGNGYMGRDLSGSGWGLKFDFIVIHESGHEWFGNSITTKDVADMWVHESFTNYSEALYLESLYGKKAGDEYVQGIRRNIANDIPIVGQYNVNSEGSGDMYYKGANMLHIIRQLMQDDQKFRQMLRGLNSTFYHKTVTGQEVQQFMEEFSGLDLSKIFEQYLTTTKVPKLELSASRTQSGMIIRYRWTNCVAGFNMPTRILTAPDTWTWIHPTENWQEIATRFTEEQLNALNLKDPNFYIN